MESLFDLLDVLVLPLELLLFLFLFHIVFKDTRRVAFHIIEVNVEPIGQVAPTSVLDELPVDSIFEAEMQDNEKADDVDEARDHELVVEVLLLIATGP